MEKYRVTIEGRTYEVIVEAVGNESISEEPVSKEQPSEAPVLEAKSGTPVTAPLSGVILSVKVKPGDVVRRGQVLLTLEALKLENEIVAPVDGKVIEVTVEGRSVETGEVLAVIG